VLLRPVIAAAPTLNFRHISNNNGLLADIFR